MKPKQERALVGIITLAGLLALFAKLSLFQNPTVEGKRGKQ